MKTLKITLLFACSLFFVGAKAQILQNSLLLGGSMNFDYSSGSTEVSGTINETRSEPTSIVFGIEPRFGYFLADNFALGLNMDFRVNSVSDENTTTTTRLIAGPFARVYFPVSENIYGFGELSFGGGIDSRSVYVGTDTTRNAPVSETVTVSNFQVGVGPGLDFFINEYVAFEALAKYTFSNSSYSAKPLYSTVTDKYQTIGHNVRITLGLQIYLRAVTAGVRE